MSNKLRVLSFASKNVFSYSTKSHTTPLFYSTIQRCYTTNMTDRIKQMTAKTLKPTPIGEKRAPLTPTILKPPTNEIEAQSVVPDQLLAESSSLLKEDILVVTRAIEFAQLLVGFEQANKYEIKNAYTGAIVGFIAEEESLGKGIMRNITTNHRSFTATIMDNTGTVLFKVHRPFYFISSSMTIENAYGKVIGEIQQDWHLWRRRYNLYLGKTQFARIDMGLLSWDFEMFDENNKLIASVNKNLVGIARELFTDANQYVIRMGPAIATQGQEIENPTADQMKNLHKIETPSILGGSALIVPTYDTLDIAGSLTLDKKAIALAAAIAVDFDYFSHTSGRPGIMSMLPLPFPMSSPPPPVDATAAEGTVPGEAAATPETPTGVYDKTYDNEGYTNQQGVQNEENESDYDNDDGGDGDDGGFDLGSLFDSD